MMVKSPVTYLDSAYSPDGGSLGLLLTDRVGNRISLILDRAIDTPTYDRVFLNGKKRPLSLAEETELLDELRRLSVAHAGDETASEWLASFIEAIESRR